MEPRKPKPEIASVDFLVDENGSRIDVPDDSTLRAATAVEQSVGATGPASWGRYGLVALGAVVLILLVLQLFGGGAGTDVVPGTPVVAPEQTAPTN